MSNEIPWNKKLLEKFVAETYMSDIEEKILRTRIEKGWTQQKQSMEFHISIATVNRIVRKLKDMYDVVQKQFPDDLPPRRQTKYEEYLDNN